MKQRAGQDHGADDGEADKRERRRPRLDHHQPQHRDQPARRRELIRRCESSCQHLRIEHDDRGDDDPDGGRANRRASSDASNATLMIPNANWTACRLMESGSGDQASTPPTSRFHIGGWMCRRHTLPIGSDRSVSIGTNCQAMSRYRVEKRCPDAHSNMYTEVHAPAATSPGLAISRPAV